MKTIIAGSRTITNMAYLKKAINDSGFNITEIISGGAKGVDRLGEDYARAAGIDLVTFHANWKKHGKAAGPIRNKRMAEYASSEKNRRNGLIALWDGVSRGTKNMIDSAKCEGLKVFIYLVDN